MGLVLVAAIVFSLIRHPEALRAVIVPLFGGLFVVLPVLGTIELSTPRSQLKPQPGWAVASAAIVVAVLGSIAAVVVGLFLLSLFD